MQVPLKNTTKKTKTTAHGQLLNSKAKDKQKHLTLHEYTVNTMILTMILLLFLSTISLLLPSSYC